MINPKEVADIVAEIKELRAANRQFQETNTKLREAAAESLSHQELMGNRQVSFLFKLELAKNEIVRQAAELDELATEEHDVPLYSKREGLLEALEIMEKVFPLR